MAKLKLLIVDEDKVYLENILNYIMIYIKKFEVVGFSSIEKSINYLEENDDIDIIAISGSVLNCDLIKKIDKISKIFLYEGDKIEVPKDFVLIDKYQRLDSIVEKIFYTYAHELKRDDISLSYQKDTKILSFYSPIGGSGKTTLALSFARIADYSGFKALYINFEQFFSLNNVIDMSQNKNCLSKIFFGIKSKLNIEQVIKETILRDEQLKLDCILPFKSCLEVDEISIYELQTFVSHIKKFSDYKFIIFDLSSQLNHINNILMEASDNIIIPRKCDEVSTSKIHNFNQELIRHEYKIIQEKIAYIFNFCDDSKETIKEKFIQNDNTIFELIETNELMLNRMCLKSLISNKNAFKKFNNLIEQINNDELYSDNAEIKVF